MKFLIRHSVFCVFISILLSACQISEKSHTPANIKLASPLSDKDLFLSQSSSWQLIKAKELDQHDALYEVFGNTYYEIYQNDRVIDGREDYPSGSAFYIDVFTGGVDTSDPESRILTGVLQKTSSEGWKIVNFDALGKVMNDSSADACRSCHFKKGGKVILGRYP
ncbi:MAG: hypothetical protein KDI30_10555 [Pseudomonadales bacterium]|nr:hypothetical protein [Pseudomonadales bacterium]